MIIRDLDVIGVAVDESKIYAPLVVNRNRILSLPIVLQLRQTIAGRDPQIGQTRGVLDILEFSNRPSNDIRGEPFRPAHRVEFPGGPIREGFDHPLNVNYHVTLVKLGKVGKRREIFSPKTKKPFREEWLRFLRIKKPGKFLTGSTSRRGAPMQDVSRRSVLRHETGRGPPDGHEFRGRGPFGQGSEDFFGNQVLFDSGKLTRDQAPVKIFEC